MTGVLTDVLMVDDDISYQKLCARWLARDPSSEYRITTCQTGAQALKECLTTSFACLLVDYRLPDMTGTRFVKILRQSLGENTPGIIVMTADGGECAATEALRVDAGDFLSKHDATAHGLRRSVANTINTERMRIDMRARQRELQKAHTELQLQQIQLQEANDELMRRSSEIQSFYHTLSHEMKTPLTATREFVSIVNDQLVGKLNEKQLEILGMSLSCCDQMNRHFNDLLDMTRLETGKFTIDIQPVSLQGLIKRSIAMISNNAKSRSITVDCRGINAIPTVLIDEGRISQVVDNLLSNALKFTPEGGRIRLSASNTRNNTICIRIFDTGTGIPSGQISKIFDRLYQIDRGCASLDDKGLGLGLSISREIVKRHGHQLKVVSRENVGSCFSFKLDTTGKTINMAA